VPTPPAKNVPVITTPPSIVGTPLIGQSVTCTNGSWTNNPTGFSFQWNRGGQPISGAASQSLTVPQLDPDDKVLDTPDDDDLLTCTVTASNGEGSSAPASSAAVTPLVPSPQLIPANTAAPAILGMPLPPNRLTCSPGSWSESPTGFAFQWARNGTPITGANGSIYRVQIADRGSTLTCAVTASNAAGPSRPSVTPSVVVALPRTLNCPQPSGGVHEQQRGRASFLGPISVGMTRPRARARLPRFTSRPPGIDDFCLFGGWDIEAAYATASLVKAVPASARPPVGSAVLVLTGNPFYALRGIAPGMSFAQVSRGLAIFAQLRSGSTTWFFAALNFANGVIEVRDGVVQQIGIADKGVTAFRGARERLFRTFQL
jgi:hypothetical protein